MADYTTSKPGIGATFPEHAIETAYGRLEPIITPDQLTVRYLFGLPLVSQMKDPFTGKQIPMTPEMVRELIDSAVQKAELELDFDIYPVQRAEKYPFDRQAYNSYGYVQLENRPVTSIDSLSIVPPNNMPVFYVPLDWVETAYLPRGQLNLIPITAAFVQGTVVPVGPAGAAYYLFANAGVNWIPAYWQINYTSGFKDALVPRVVNDYIGILAAMDILSMLAATFARTNSHSLSLDGQSQSVSTPGPQVFAARLQDLENKKKVLGNKIKTLMGRKIFSTYT